VSIVYYQRVAQLELSIEIIGLNSQSFFCIPFLLRRIDLHLSLRPLSCAFVAWNLFGFNFVILIRIILLCKIDKHWFFLGRINSDNCVTDVDLIKLSVCNRDILSLNHLNGKPNNKYKECFHFV
jgi:hypothetical protein